MEATSPPPPTTVRRNPPRRARPPPTPLTGARPKPSSLSRLLEDEAASARPKPSSLSIPLEDEAASTASVLRPPQEDSLKVFLRIRPLPDRRDRSRPTVPAAKPPRKPKQAVPATGPGEVCLVPTGPSSVALTVPQSKLVDAKRRRTEVFDGFSTVFPSNSTQPEVFAQVMNPLVDDFLGGKSGLLVAMGPTGSGKTHTIFGSPRNPGILPLTLRKIFNAQGEDKVANKPTRSFFLSMFEILSEGKGEHILDLLSDAVECVLQQSVIKGLQEVAISDPAHAESLVSRGTLKRSTAATNANSNSSRSQCIITIRADSEHPLSSAVLTIADLAGAERERRTGNQGSRLLESNFINNTSMVFSNCLRSLLEHQKNQKKPLEKHFKNSMLTRYLRDYLEGRKKMTLILNVKPGDDDYLDTSFLLRQASPYMKIKYTNLEDSSDLASQKRTNASLICQEGKKKRKVQKPEVLVVERNKRVDADNVSKVSEKDGAQHVSLNPEIPGVSRSEAIMTNFARALLTVGRQYKNKLLESEKLIRDKDIQIMELKKELEAVKYCLCKSSPITEDESVNHDGQAAHSLVSVSNQPDLGSYNESEDNFHVEAQELTCCGPKNSPAPCILKGESDNCDASSISLRDEQVCSRDFKVELQVLNKELDTSESFTAPTPTHTGGAMPASSYSDQCLTEEKHPEPWRSSQQENIHTEVTSTSESTLLGTVASKTKLEELNQKSERCEPSVEKATVELEHGIDCGQALDQNCDHARVEAAKVELQVLNKELDTSESFTVPTPTHNQSLTEEKHLEPRRSSESSLLRTVASETKLEELNQKSERCEPSVEKATVELEHGIDCGQASDQKCDHAPAKAVKVELQVLNKELYTSESFAVPTPTHTSDAMPASDQSLTEEKHPDPEPLSSSQQENTDTEVTSSSESSLLGTVASETKLEELNQKSERCEPAVEKATVELEHGIDCVQAPDQKCDHSPKKAAKAPSKGREADETEDTKEDFESRPGNTKKTRRRLQPAAAMMFREFTGADIDVDNEREERGRSSAASVATGRSDVLVQLLMKGRRGGPIR